MSTLPQSKKPLLFRVEVRWCPGLHLKRTVPSTKTLKNADSYD